MEIKTLVADIYATVRDRQTEWFDADIAKALSDTISTKLHENFNEGERAPGLRLSKMGPTCPRALWHSVHTPELAEPFNPWTQIKFGYGHIIEAYALALARAAGHTVEGEQDAVYVDGIAGHRDAVIDGCLVDVKSCGRFVFNKLKDGRILEDDMFGYLDQLDGYAVGSMDDPIVRVKDKAYIFGVDQQLGHMVLYEHKVRERSIRTRIAKHKAIVDLRTPPPCECEVEPYGKSGNVRLGVKASYSLYKHCCFPLLRTFIYSEGPVYLATVAKRPDVPEINKAGQRIN